MKINEHTALLTPRVLLVPYSAHHVPTYHEWMQDPAIREATASEPLTLDEEYAMQRSWRNDPDKLTFIVCVAPPPPADKIKGKLHDAPTAMIGDVNLFLIPDDEEADDTSAVLVGELEIMIASPVHQNRGYGAAVLPAFMAYIRRHLDAILAEYCASPSSSSSSSSLSPAASAPARLKHLRVKIGAVNGRSLRLFERVGFVRVSEMPNYFGELELRRDLQESKDEEVQRLEAGKMVELRYEITAE